MFAEVHVAGQARNQSDVRSDMGVCWAVQWLNRMLQGMWPYYDKAIGAAIKEAVEPMMEQYKPPGLIKKIYFAKLTFGDAPMRIDNVWVEDEGEQHVLLEVHMELHIFPSLLS